MEFFAKIGTSVEGSLAYLGSLTSLAGRAAYFTFIGPFKGKLVERGGGSIVNVASFVAILGAATSQISYTASKGAVLSMTRELGPLITAVIVIGRSGSAFAAELGTMKVSEEIDALETMAIHPVGFLVAPKFVAMLIMLPCLTIWANFMGIIGGSVFGVAQADFTFSRYVIASLDALFLRDVITGLIKSFMFGATITAVGCLEGLNTTGGAEQVGRSTTRAVVMSIFLVILVDLVFTMLFYFLGEH